MIELKGSKNQPYVWINQKLSPVAIASLDNAMSYTMESYENGPYTVNLLKKHEKTGSYFFPSGLVSEAIEILTELGYEVTYVSGQKVPRKLSNDINWKGPELWQHQQEALLEAHTCFKSGQGVILHIPTRGGKTLISLKLIQELRASTIIIVHNEELLRQWKEEIKEKLGVNAGEIKESTRDIQNITIAMVQTLNNAIKKGEKFYFDFLIVDEIHHYSSAMFYYVAMRINSYYRMGLSVDDQTYIELKGGVFESGWTGTIKDAWKILEKEHETITNNGYEIINMAGEIKSRGWENGNFTWKSIKSMIRHKNNECGIDVKVGGDNLVLTKKHSVYKIENGSYKWINNAKKFYPVLKTGNANEIERNDILVQDNGNKWEENNKKKTILEVLLKSNINKTSTHIAIKLKDKTTRHDLELTSAIWHQKNNRAKYGMELSLEEYKKYNVYVEETNQIYTEGANGISTNSNEPIENLAYLMGMYIGNGWLDSKRMNIAIKDEDKDKIEKYITSMPGCKFGINWRKMKGRSYEARCSNAIIYSVLEYYFNEMYAWSKEIPGEWIVNWSEYARRQLLQGIIDTDGHKATKNKKSIMITTTSYKLARDILSLLRSINVNGSITKQNTIGKLGGVINGRQIIAKHDTYQVVFSGNALNKNNNGHNGTREKYIHDEIKFNERRVRSISEKKTSSFVYDLEMYGHPSFCANGILVHNSATPRREDGDDKKFIAAIGKIVHPVSVSELIERGILVKPRFIFYKCKVTDKTGYKSWEEAYKKGIVDNVDRNDMIVDITSKYHDKQVYIHVIRISHGKQLQKLIPGSVFVSGKDTTTTREKALSDFKSGKIKRLVSTLMGEGVNIPTMDVIINAAGGKSWTSYVQRLGRVLTASEGKHEAIVIDFLDHSHKWHRDHSQRRMEIIKEMFPTEEMTIV